jgi:type I restriction enzyme S subunit
MSELPNGWEMMRLGEIAARTSSVDPARSPDERFELYSVPSFSARSPETLLGAEIKSVKQAIQPGDILLCKIVPHINRVWVVGPKTALRQIGSGEWIIYRDHECEPSYLCYCLTEGSFREKFLTTVSGVGGSLLRARPSAVADIEVPIAPLAEQRRIVAKLDTLTGATDRARTELDCIPNLITRYKQSILSAAYQGELTREWRASTGSIEPRLATLDELVAEGIRNGLSVRGSDEPPGVRALRLSALRGGSVDLMDVRYLPITEDRAERFLLREGDVLVSRGNGTKAFVGLAALVGKVEEPTIFPDTAFRIRLNQEMARSDWFALLWNAAQVRGQIERAAKTTAGIWKVNQTDLVKVELRLPDAAEQLEIVRRVTTAFAWLDRVAAEHEKAQHLLPRLDHAILAKAFYGQLVPQDPNDEPASVFLERVLAARVDAPKRGRTVRARTKFSERGALTVAQKEQDMNKTRKDVSGNHLCEIVKKSGGRIKTDALWQASEMQIDEFYKLLRDNVVAKRLRESKDRASITDAN